MSGSTARTEYFKERVLSTARSILEYHSKIDIDENAPMIRSVGIICTIGKVNFLKPYQREVVV